MPRPVRSFQYFFYSQAFADGVRTTVAILLPALIGSYFGQLELGMSVSLGALCVSLSDAPGPLHHKRNAMAICTGFIFLVALLTPVMRVNIYLMGIEVVLVAFFFSMFNVYGARATAVGNAAILVMILTMDQPAAGINILVHASLIGGGGLWYLLLSVAFYHVQPYKPAQRSLGDVIRETAQYLSIKADFYDPSTKLSEDYKKLIAQHIIVSEKQDGVREILFKTRKIVTETTPTGRRLVWTFVESVDLFEDITVTYYDYEGLRNRYSSSGLLDEFSRLLKRMSDDLDRFGGAVQSNESYLLPKYETDLVALKSAIDALPRTEKETHLVLRKILVNIRKLVMRFGELNRYFNEGEEKRGATPLDHAHFVGHQPLDPAILWNNINWDAAVFRHSLRVAIACFIGYVLVRTIDYGPHSYWILLTIAFILKPAFSLTKERNIQRITGTLVGGLAGVLILVFIPNKEAQSVFMVLFMLGTYSFLRTNYLAMVLCVTPFVIILFNFLGLHFSDVAKERLLDTTIGCIIAFSASYFIFPTWESDQLKPQVKAVLQANAAYLGKLIDALWGKPFSALNYKLARKEVYIASANVTAAFQRMLSEPKRKQKSSRQLHQFVVLNHILFSNIATLLTTVIGKEPKRYPHGLSVLALRTQRILEETVCKLDGRQPTPPVPATNSQTDEPEIVSPDDHLLKDQLEFISRVAVDIEKNVKQL